jgi:ferredoxin-NADP reductase
MAMLRHRRKIGATNKTALLFSIRSNEDVIYQNELAQLATEDNSFNLLITFTRQPPASWMGYRRRIDLAMLSESLKLFEEAPNCFICGSTTFVEQTANNLLDLGLPTDAIRTERFGPTGPGTT